MATAITAPLEKQFGQMPGLNQMTSSSSSTSSLITLQFDLNMGLDVAEQEVQAAINAATNFLPTDLPFPPIYSKVNPADTPILTLALTSKTVPLPQVEDYADTRFGPKISQVTGVGLVSISGGQRPAVRVEVNTTALAALGLTMEGVRAVISASNVNTAKGNFDGPELGYIINANDQLTKSEEYKPLILTYLSGAPVRLSDVAHVYDGVENTNLAAWMNETPAVILNVQRQPGSNVIAVVDRIKQLLPKLSATLPKTVDVSVLSDRTESIRASVSDAAFELCLSVLLVVIVIFIFLRNITATVIPSISVPLSLVGTLGAMYLFGFSLNNLTLMALTIATGFVVDDAIVMIENISRYIENGVPPVKAALRGAKQIGFTIISLTFSLIAVLIPLLFMKDIVGRLFREFALTLSVTILISAFVSLTLTPMMCCKILRHRKESEMSRFERYTGRKIDELIEYYGSSLRTVLNHQPLTLFIALLTLVITLLLFYLIPKGFFPVQDTGLIQGISEASQSISFPAMMERQQALTKIVLQDEAVANVSSFIGIDGTNTTLNRGRLLISLKPMDSRNVTATEVIHRLQQKLDNVAGAKLYMQPVQDISVDDRISLTQYQYSVGSVNAESVAEWSNALVNKLKLAPELRDVANDLQAKGLYTKIEYDRDTASRLGITPLMIDNTLYDAFGQRQISIIFTQFNQYRVILLATPRFKNGIETLNDIYLNSATNTLAGNATNTAITTTAANVSALSSALFQTNSNAAPSSTATNYASISSANSRSRPPVVGGAIPLSVFTRISEENGPLIINRQGQFPVAMISFNLSKGAALGDAIRAFRDAKEELQIPDSVQTSFEGSAKVFENSLANEGWLVLAAIVVVYIVLGVLYESYIHPITILSTLPSATMGALFGLMLTGNALSIIALIGIILLIGIVMKNAIMMIDFALDLERTQHKSARDAIYEACMLRFRPIVMTTFAAMLGAVPLALAMGMGAELRRPLGIAIVAGLIVSQLLTLYTTPVIYLYFDRLSKRFNRFLRQAGRANEKDQENGNGNNNGNSKGNSNDDGHLPEMI